MNRKAPLRRVGGFTLIVIGIAFLGLWIFGIWSSIKANIDASRASSWLIRAKNAGTPGQVAEFLANYQEELSQYTHGRKYYCVFRYAGCAIAPYQRSIQGLIERAEALSRQSAIDTSYQLGLSNLEADVDDIESVAFGLWWANWGWAKVIPLASLGWLWVLICISLGVSALPPSQHSKLRLNGETPKGRLCRTPTT